MIRILGADVATHTGWAVMEKPWKLIECGLITTNIKGGMRFLRFEKAMREVIATYQPDACAFEIWRAHKGVISAEILGGYAAVLSKLCAEYGIPDFGLEVGAIKKHGTGNHQASKELMVKTAKRLWPQADIQTDDVADALHIARLGLTKV